MAGGRGSALRFLRFTTATVVSLLLFTLGCLVVAWIHHSLTGLSFSASWRWIHDTTILPSNLALIPPLGLAILIQVLVGRQRFDFMRVLPQSARQLVFLIIAIFIANSVSQSLGGCVWFVFTEGWWVRFGHGWILPDGSVLAEPIVIAAYVLFTVLAVASGTWFYRHYLDKD